MNRIDFLHSLYLALNGIPETERRAMLAPYEAAFRDGTREGRSEEDIAHQLGDPAEIAQRLLSDRDGGRTPMWNGAGTGPQPSDWQAGACAPPPGGNGNAGTPPPGWNGSAGAPPPGWNGSAGAPPPGWNGNAGAPPPGWNGNAGMPPPGWRPARRGCLSSCLIGCLVLFLNLCFVLGPVLAVYGLLFGGWCASIGFSLGGIVAFAGSLVATTMPGWVPDSLSMATLLSGSVMMASAGLLLGMGLWHVTRWTFRLTGRYLKWTADMVFNKSA